MKSVVAQINPIQEGSGDPSPTNVRPISGWSGVDVRHSGADQTNPTVYSVPFKDENGNPITVYGGTLEVASGKLTITKVFFNARDVEWIVADSTRIYTRLPLSPTELTTILCSHCKYVRRPPAGSLESWVDWGGYPASNKNLILALGEHTTSLENWNAYTQSNDVQFVYELATPTEIQLTPTEVKTLLGLNNVWCDTGDTSVEYPADTKLYIDRKINAMI
jgi:hypothetical protein